MLLQKIIFNPLYPYMLWRACFQRKTTLVINIHICVSCLLSHSPQWGKNLCEVAYDFLHPQRFYDIFSNSRLCVRHKSRKLVSGWFK